MVGSVVVVGALTYCALLHSMYDVKAAQIKVQCISNWELYAL